MLTASRAGTVQKELEAKLPSPDGDVPSPATGGAPPSATMTPKFGNGPRKMSGLGRTRRAVATSDWKPSPKLLEKYAPRRLPAISKLGAEQATVLAGATPGATPGDPSAAAKDDAAAKDAADALAPKLHLAPDAAGAVPSVSPMSSGGETPAAGTGTPGQPTLAVPEAAAEEEAGANAAWGGAPPGMRSRMHGVDSTIEDALVHDGMGEWGANGDGVGGLLEFAMSDVGRDALALALGSKQGGGGNRVVPTVAEGGGKKGAPTAPSPWSEGFGGAAGARQYLAVRRETPFAMLRDALAYAVAVAWSWAAIWCFLAQPAYFAPFASASLVVLNARRLVRYYRVRWHHFCLEACYFGNLMLLVWLWLPRAYRSGTPWDRLPSERHQFMVLFAWTQGVMASGVWIMRNSLVFESWDKMTSCAIHLLPAMLTLRLRFAPAGVVGTSGSAWHRIVPADQGAAAFCGAAGCAAEDGELVEWLLVWPVVLFAAHRLLLTFYVELLPHRKLRKCPTYKHSRLLMQEWYFSGAQGAPGGAPGRGKKKKAPPAAKAAEATAATAAAATVATVARPTLADPQRGGVARPTGQAGASQRADGAQPALAKEQPEEEPGEPKKPAARRKKRGMLNAFASALIRATCGFSTPGIIMAHISLSILQMAATSAVCIVFWRYENVLLAHLGLLLATAVFNGGTLRAYKARKYRRALETVVKAEHSAAMRRRCFNCGYVAKKEYA